MDVIRNVRIETARFWAANLMGHSQEVVGGVSKIRM